MRVLHTSDWHLGHLLHGYARDAEHRRFLGWLRREVTSRAVDALLIAGDVFDGANPPASSLEMFYEFLAGLRVDRPGLEVVVIAGNHDSASRLDAPRSILQNLGVTVVGAAPARAEDMLVPIRVGGEVAAWVLAVPFLRPADLPPADDAGDPLIAGVLARYRQAIDAALVVRSADQPLIAMGHLYMVGGQISEMSERRVLGGNQHPVPVEIFGDEVSYAALGHLHKAQRVGGREEVRYCGSPIPLSLAEASYRHQVLVVDFDGAELREVESVPVPRFVELVRVPTRGSAALDQVLAELERLPEATSEVTSPFLEVCVQLQAPVADLRDQIENALRGKGLRLCKIGVEYAGDALGLADLHVGERLADLQPHEVFSRRYQRDYEGEPPADLVELFHEIVDAVSQEPA